MQGVQGAREWAAPRLEDAADAITATVAPKVSSALRSTARQVHPADTGKKGIRRLLSWRWLLGIGAAVAAAGAAAAVTMRRYQSATADAKDSANTLADDPATETDETANQSGVNGRVTSGR
jgi:hypothetical protein